MFPVGTLQNVMKRQADQEKSRFQLPPIIYEVATKRYAPLPGRKGQSLSLLSRNKDITLKVALIFLIHLLVYIFKTI